MNKLKISEIPKSQWQRVVRKAKKRFEQLKETDRVMAGRFVSPLYLYSRGEKTDDLFNALSFLVGEKVEE